MKKGEKLVTSNVQGGAGKMLYKNGVALWEFGKGGNGLELRIDDELVGKVSRWSYGTNLEVKLVLSM